jgi:hypothetical protein
MITKVCSKCGTPKSLDDFSPHPKCKGGKRGTCKSCASTFSVKWQALKKSTLVGQLEYLLRSAKSRARASEVPFDLGIDFLIKLHEDQNGVCSVTKLRFCNEPTESHASPYALSIDRIQPKKGYVEGNVQLVLLAVNLAKNDWPVQDLSLIWLRMAQGASEVPLGLDRQIVEFSSPDPLPSMQDILQQLDVTELHQVIQEGLLLLRDKALRRSYGVNDVAT